METLYFGPSAFSKIFVLSDSPLPSLLLHLLSKLFLNGESTLIILKREMPSTTAKHSQTYSFHPVDFLTLPLSLSLSLSTVAFFLTTAPVTTLFVGLSLQRGGDRIGFFLPFTTYLLRVCKKSTEGAPRKARLRAASLQISCGSKFNITEPATLPGKSPRSGSASAVHSFDFFRERNWLDIHFLGRERDASTLLIFLERKGCSLEIFIERESDDKMTLQWWCVYKLRKRCSELNMNVKRVILEVY